MTIELNQWKTTQNTFYHGDCKLVMEHDIDIESVDLIYLDPPFFTGQIQKGTWEPGAMEMTFEDSKRYWGESEKAIAVRKHAPVWIQYIAETRPEFASYLYYMMERLELCHKVLKKTGSIYLHCDYRASHYLKMVMDEVFEIDNFQNEIVWHYTGGGRSKRYFSRKHDVIFLYSKNNNMLFNIDEIRIPYKETSGYAQGGIVSKSGKLYLPNPNGTPVDDVWDIPIINPLSKERTGYPTQKPLALLERIILASSNEGDLVLDPFAGCGTTIIAAHKLNRRWVGIDISGTAYEVTRTRKETGVQMALGMPTELGDIHLVCRDLNTVMASDSSLDFEYWVREFYNADRPIDKGVDGITKNGIAIQVKAWANKVDDSVVRQLAIDAKMHPNVPKPVTKAILVSKFGFTDKAKAIIPGIKRELDIDIELVTPEMMLQTNGVK